MITHTRWTPTRKKLAMIALQRGDFTREDFMKANSISEEELAEWDRGLAVNNLRISQDTANIRARRP